MATTVIFVEIMIMGLLTFAWLFILSLRVGIIPSDELNTLLPILKEWSTPILILAAALAYQLGSLMNTTSFGIMEHLFGNRIKKSIMSPYDNEIASAAVKQKGTPETIQGIQAHTTYIRLARSAIFNFFFLGMTLLLLGGHYRGIGILFLLLSLIGYPVWRTIYKLRYHEMRAAYEVVRKLENTTNRINRNRQEKK